MVGGHRQVDRVRQKTWALALFAVTACAAAPSKGAASPPPGSARIPERANPCVVAAVDAANVDDSAPRDFSRAKEAFDRGLGHQRAGRHDEALSEFKRAVVIDPTFALAHLEAAVSHLYTDNSKEAMLKHLANAVVLLPTNPRAQLQFGRLQREIGNESLAERHIDCALDLAPELAPAHETMARLFFSQGRDAEAERRARSAVALAPAETTYRVLLADVLTRRSRWLEAGVEVEQAAKQVGRSAALYRRAAELYDKGGAADDADRMRAAADRLDPPPERRRLRPLRRRR